MSSWMDPLCERELMHSPDCVNNTKLNVEEYGNTKEAARHFVCTNGFMWLLTKNLRAGFTSKMYCFLSCSSG